MDGQIAQHIEKRRAQGFAVEETLSVTSVVMTRKRLFFKKSIYIWIDDRGAVRESKEGISNLTARLSEDVRDSHIIRSKLAWSHQIAPVALDPSDWFSQLLLREFEDNRRQLTELDDDIAALRDEIRYRNFLGKMNLLLRGEVERCLGVGYEIKKLSESSAVLVRRGLKSGGTENLQLATEPGGQVSKNGGRGADMQGRLEALISLFKMYRTMKPPIGREKHFLDRQFEIDAEINALHAEMVYFGHSPDIGDYEL